MEKPTLSKWILTGIFQILVFTSGISHAAKIVLDFEGIGNLNPVNDFYDAQSYSPGTPRRNFGIRFSDPATALVDLDAGGSGNFANEPSNDTAMLFGFGGNPTMNVASGFDTGFSFFYSYGLSDKATINIYDGLDGTGKLLSSFILSSNMAKSCSGDPFGDFCQWDPIGVKFKGLAKSVVFDGPAEAILYDNMTLGSEHPGKTLVPLPGAFWLMGSALLGLLRFKRRT